MACVEDIPPVLVARLLPSPDISVRQFLSFVLPCQLGDTISIDYTFWSETPPEPVDISNVATTLTQLPIPSPTVLNLITQDHAQALSNGYNKLKSITYAHLPSTNPASKVLFPKWVFEYWVQVSHLRQFVRVPWVKAESWVSDQHLMRFPDRSHLANQVHEVFSQIPWTGYLSGFSDHDAPMTTVAMYLSSSWLTTTMINQQLDLLRIRARLQLLPAKFEIADTHFFPKLVELYRLEKTDRTYKSESPPKKNRYIWNIGQELANPESVKQFICGICNIKNSHWVSVVIDAERNMVLYGDSMGCFDKPAIDEIMAAVRWWATVHLKRE